MQYNFTFYFVYRLKNNNYHLIEVYMSIKEAFAKRLKEIRKKRGYTQEELAELVDVAPRHISFIETAKSFPSTDLIERLCKILKINYNELFRFDETFSRKELLENISEITKRLDNEKLAYIYKMASEL